MLIPKKCLSEQRHCGKITEHKISSWRFYRYDFHSPLRIIEALHSFKPEGILIRGSRRRRAIRTYTSTSQQKNQKVWSVEEGAGPDQQTRWLPGIAGKRKMLGSQADKLRDIFEDPQKMLQLILAAESGRGGGASGAGFEPRPGGGGGSGTSSISAGSSWSGGTDSRGSPKWVGLCRLNRLSVCVERQE